METVKYCFKGKIKQTPGLNAAFIEIPDDIVQAMGGKGRYKVMAEIGGIPYRGSIQRMEKSGPLLLIATQEVRSRAGLNFNDTVTVNIKVDNEIREIKVPEELKTHLEKDIEAAGFFFSLSYTHRKEYCTWISGGVKPETRQKRAERALLMLRKKIRHP